MTIKLSGYLEERKNFTNTVLDAIRADLATKYTDEQFCIVADGSYARREASEVSDIDFYVIYKGRKPTEHLLTDITNVLKKHVKEMPSEAGPFATISSLDNMVVNIGGNNDENSSLTKRILLLLEGDWLFNKELFDHVREELIEIYVKEEISEKQIALFLLNDIIRYYRTICVDFNYKTIEAAKPWAIRNIKLVFSRKFLYYCGVLAVAETANMSAKQKREKLIKLFNLPPIERLIYICGPTAEDALELYELFLIKISDATVRDNLKAVNRNRSSHNELFRELKNAGHKFTHELYRLLAIKYDNSHPIHRMLVL